MNIQGTILLTQVNCTQQASGDITKKENCFQLFISRFNSWFRAGWNRQFKRLLAHRLQSETRRFQPRCPSCRLQSSPAAAPAPQAAREGWCVCASYITLSYMRRLKQRPTTHSVLSIHYVEDQASLFPRPKKKSQTVAARRAAAQQLSCPNLMF